MRFSGFLIKQGRWWAIEAPLLDVVTQGKSRKDAYSMLAEAIELLCEDKGLKVKVIPGKGNYFEIAAQDPAQSTLLFAFMLRQQRAKSGLSLEQAAKRLGVNSKNAYARYERGVTAPTLLKMQELLHAIRGRDFVLVESAA